MKKNIQNEETLKVSGPKASFFRFFLFFLFALVLIAADQYLKYRVLNSNKLMNGGEIVVIEEFFSLRYAFNTGAAWSFLANVDWGIYALTGVSILAGIVFFLLLIRYSSWPFILPFSLSLTFAGTVGNLIDRIRFQGVVDFFDFYYKGWHFPTFNIADSSIVVGMILLLIYVVFFEEKDKKKFRQDQRLRIRKI